MLISTGRARHRQVIQKGFQSLDWVDVDFDVAYLYCHILSSPFQSLDWVDVDFDVGSPPPDHVIDLFQSLDWVDVDFDRGTKGRDADGPVVSIPRLG